MKRKSKPYLYFSYLLILSLFFITSFGCDTGSVGYSGGSQGVPENILENGLEKSEKIIVVGISENDADLLNYETSGILDPETLEEILNTEVLNNLIIGTLEDGNNEDITEPPTPKPYIIAIDPGHQLRGNNEHEPIGPNARETKPKVSSGTRGVYTNVPEYELTLAVSFLLRDELESRGYTVVMIRESHDVNISNRERAGMATDAEADIFLRIHADGSTNSNVNGILLLCPRADNPFVAHLYEQSRFLSDTILNAMIETTGARNRGVLEVNNMSGINWATMPVTIIELGLMTNINEDKLMQTEEYQMKLVLGIADGVDEFFSYF